MSSRRANLDYQLPDLHLCIPVSQVGTKRSSLFAYRVTLILNDRVIIKGVQDIMKKKIPDGPTERERHV